MCFIWLIIWKLCRLVKIKNIKIRISYFLKSNLNSIFGNLLSTDWIVIDLDTFTLTTWINKTTLYTAIQWLNWWIWNPAVHNWNNTTFGISNNVNLWARYLISDYLTLNSFTTLPNLKIFYKSSTEIWIISSDLQNIWIASYGTDQTKHFVNNLRQPENTTLWWALINGFLYLDNITGKVIYFDNWWIWYFNKWNLLKYWWRWIPYLDAWNYSWLWNRVVFGDSTWNAWVWSYWTNNDPWTINLKTIPSITTWVDNYYYVDILSRFIVNHWTNMTQKVPYTDMYFNSRISYYNNYWFYTISTCNNWCWRGANYTNKRYYSFFPLY